MLPRVNPRPARRASPSSNARPVPELSKTATCSPRAQRLRARPTGGPPACLQRRAPNPGCAVTTRGQSPHPLASQHKQATTQAPALCPSVGMRARVGPRASLHSPAPQSLGTSVRLALKTLRGAGSLATLGLVRRQALHWYTSAFARAPQRRTACATQLERADASQNRGTTIHPATGQNPSAQTAPGLKRQPARAHRRPLPVPLRREPGCRPPAAPILASPLPDDSASSASHCRQAGAREPTLSPTKPLRFGRCS